jgi:hypothetical protein
LTAGGWCPAGRAAEDGAIPPRYPLRKTASADPAERTRLNVRDSDATLIVTAVHVDSPGTIATAAHASRLGRPCLILLDGPPDASSAAACALHPPTCDIGPLVPELAAVRRLSEWLAHHGVVTLNVAGPRASEWPEGYERTTALLRRLAQADSPA